MTLLATKENMITEELIESVRRLDAWLTRNGWAGYDPYDIRGHRWLLKPGDSILKAALEFGAQKFPHACRRLMHVRKEVNAKAMGLFASAYLSLHSRFQERVFLDKALECLAWLEVNPSRGYPGVGWGCPFDWQTLAFLPRNTPFGTVSAICGEAFCDFYKFSRNQKYLQIAQNVCEFFLRGLNIDHVSNSKICFSYSPLDRFHVHNANLFVAAFLLEVGQRCDRQDLTEYGLKAMNFSVDEQNADGSFYYWSLREAQIPHMTETTLKTIDHYHTGFVLRSLHSIYHVTGEKWVFQSLEKGYRFYRDHLFEDRRIPKLKPDFIYPVDIHSCAEAILCLSTLSDLFPEAIEYATNVFRWTIANMQDKDGHFYYRKTEGKTNKIPYIRWGQAWMMRALTKLLETTGDGSSERPPHEE